MHGGGAPGQVCVHPSLVFASRLGGLRPKEEHASVLVRPLFHAWLLACLLCSLRAEAESTTRARTTADIFEWATPGQQRPLLRRRVVSTLDTVASTPLREDSESGREALVFTMRTRLDLEGGSSFSDSPAALSTFVPGFERGPVDLVSLHVTARALFGDHVDVGLGRQLVNDAAGFASFDGLRVRWRPTPAGHVEVRGGFETRYAMPLSGGGFEADGVLRASRENWAASAAPSVLDLSPMPYIAAEAWADSGPLQGALAYRRTADPSTGGLSREEFAVSASTSANKPWWVSAQARYALHAARLATLRLDSVQNLGRGWDATASYTFFQPTFDAASIWNAFFAAPTSALGLDVRRTLGRLCNASVGGDLAVLAASTGTPAGQMGGRGSLRCAVGRGTSELRLRSRWGAAGTSHSLVFWGMEYPVGNRWTLRTRAQSWLLEGAERADWNGAGAGGVLGAHYTLSSQSLGGVDLERNWGPGPDASVRVMAYLDVAVWP